VQFYGAVGKDGEWIVEEMKGHGVDVSGILEPTGRAIIQVSDDGENSIILFPGANHSDIHETHKASATKWFPGATHLLLQNEIAFTSTVESLIVAKDEGLHSVLNPSPMFSKDQIPRFPWEKVDWLLINEGEGNALLRGFSPYSSETSILQKLSDIPAFKNTNIIYTLGSQGAMAYIPSLHSANTFRAPAAQLRGEVRDTTGAGDCFTGFFVAGIMQLDRYTIGKEDVERLLEVCNQAAGMSVDRPGTIDSIPTQEEVVSRMAKV
ncbi:Ribokinase-like protein, partial [Coprinellus micaceus]